MSGTFGGTSDSSRRAPTRSPRGRRGRGQRGRRRRFRARPRAPPCSRPRLPRGTPPGSAPSARSEPWLKMPEVARLAPMITRTRSPTLIQAARECRRRVRRRRRGARRRHPRFGRRADPQVLGRGELGRRRRVVVFVGVAGGDLDLPRGRLDVAARDRQLDQPRPPLARGQVLDPELAVEGAQVTLHRVDAEEDRVGDLLVGRRGGEVVALRDRSAERRENARPGCRSGGRRSGDQQPCGEVPRHCPRSPPSRRGAVPAPPPRTSRPRRPPGRAGRSRCRRPR